MEELRCLLETTTVGQLLECNRKLVEAQYTMTVGETLQLMQQHGISYVPVAVPAPNPSHFAHKCNKELNELEAAAGKYFVGMASSLDILVYIAENIVKQGINSASQVLETPVHSVLDKRLQLPVMSPKTSLLEAMDLMVNGMQRTLVPHASLPSLGQMEQDRKEGKESPNPCYHMITPWDIIKFMHTERSKFQPIMTRSVESFGIFHKRVLGLLESSSLIDMIRCMHQERLTAVPIIYNFEELKHADKGQLLDAKGKQISGSFAARDIQGCPLDALCKWLTMGVLDFLKKVSVMRVSGITLDTIKAHDDVELQFDMLCESLHFGLVTCGANSPLGEVLERALDNNIQQVWVLEGCYLFGVVEFVDIFKAVLNSIL